MSQENDVRDIDWYSLETDEPLDTLPTEISYDGDVICPKCQKRCTYWEGQIGQDEMGNDLDGWAFYCFPCGICTDWEYL